jgi:hypothetical protein
VLLSLTAAGDRGIEPAPEATGIEATVFSLTGIPLVWSGLATTMPNTSACTYASGVNQLSRLSQTLRKTR